MASFVKSLITRDILEWEAVLVAATSRPDVPRFVETRTASIKAIYVPLDRASDAVAYGAENSC